jgi:pimeloyl-ACP methyl ester carboxylesterase
VKFVEANGLRFAYLEQGTGPLVLMLHGFPDTAHTWDHARPRIAARGFRVVTPFLRGYHPTGTPARDADAEMIARDALALIAALGEESAILVGHDWGAMAAYGAAALDGSGASGTAGGARVRKLVTVAIPHPASLRATPAKVWGVRHFFAYKLPGAARRFARDDFAALRAIVKRWSPTWDPGDDELQPARACFANAASLDAAMGYYRAWPLRMPRWLRAPLAVPTVTFAGADDPIARPDDYEHARAWFTGPYTIETLPGGHFLHRESADAFVERLLVHL